MTARAAARAAVLAAAFALSAGCGDALRDRLADFVDVPFGDAIAEVQALDGDVLGPVMTETLLRFRSYVDLRDALPFDTLTANDACLLDVSGSASDFTVVVDVACARGAFAAAAGLVTVRQRDVSSSVVELDVDYDAVQVGALRVDGIEHIQETLTADGTSVRTLDLVQDGRAFDYAFRIGQLDAETPVFDYVVELPGGQAQLRLTNPASVGAFASAIVTGIDGSLVCEIRDAAWAPGDPAKGTCDNGAAFGL